ncbi:MAG: GNAT family protein [bacterium]|nr:GNAT family protein [bacterium]
MPPFMGSELLHGELVTLTRPTRDDIEAFTSWTHDLEYQRLLRRGMVYPSSLEGMLSWFSEMERNDKEIPFSIKTLVEDRLVGHLVINNILWQPRHCSFFIGIGGAADRGRGYGTDAVRVMLKYAFLEMNLHAVRLEVISYNPAGFRAYEKVGFRLDGTLRAWVYRDGVYYDVHTMSILRREWEALYGFPPVGYP